MKSLSEIGESLAGIAARLSTLPAESTESREIRFRAYLFAYLSAHEQLDKHEAAYDRLLASRPRLADWFDEAATSEALRLAGAGLYQSKGPRIARTAFKLASGQLDAVPDDWQDAKQAVGYFMNFHGLGATKASFACMLVGVRQVACLDTHWLASMGIKGNDAKRAVASLKNYLALVRRWKRKLPASQRSDMALASWQGWNDIRQARKEAAEAKGRTNLYRTADHAAYLTSQEAAWLHA